MCTSMTSASLNAEALQALALDDHPDIAGWLPRRKSQWAFKDANRSIGTASHRHVFLLCVSVLTYPNLGGSNRLLRDITYLPTANCSRPNT